jgi:hypothetical protein
MTNINPAIKKNLNELNQAIDLANTAPGNSGNKFFDTAVKKAEHLLIELWKQQALLLNTPPAPQYDENKQENVKIESLQVSISDGIAKIMFPTHILSMDRHSKKYYRKILSNMFFQPLVKELQSYTPPDRFICVIEPVYGRGFPLYRIPDHDNIAYRDYLNLICKAAGAEDGPRHCTGIVLPRWADKNEMEGTEFVLLPFKENLEPLQKEFELHDFIIGCATVAQPTSEKG